MDSNTKQTIAGHLMKARGMESTGVIILSGGRNFISPEERYL